MERETAGCLFLNENSITSINLLLSLNYLNFIINNNITACSILLYIPESQGSLQVLMNEQGMEKHCCFVFGCWLLPRDLSACRVVDWQQCQGKAYLSTCCMFQCFMS